VVDIAAEVVERREHGAAVAQPFQRHTVENHVGLPFRIRLERSMGGPQKARLAVIGPRHVPHFRRKPDKRRH